MQVDWPDSVKDMQRNWIGKSEGAELDFEIVDGGAGPKPPPAEPVEIETDKVYVGGIPWLMNSEELKTEMVGGPESKNPLDDAFR